MELLDYRKEFIETIKSLAAANMDFEESAFISVAAQRLYEAEEIEDFEPCYFEGVGKRKKKLRVDGYSFNDIDDSVTLLISYYEGKDTPETLTQTEAGRIFDRLKAFTEESLSGNLHLHLEESSLGYGLARELYHQKESIRRFRFFLVTDAILSSRVKDLTNEKLDSKLVEYNIWDIARFYRVFQSLTGRDELTINFDDFFTDGIPCLEASQAEGEYKAYLCIMPGFILADIYNRYGSRLLEGNVRSFLSTKGKVNKGIRNTILREPEMFFAYNNGIAATATDAEITLTNTGLRLIKAKDLQIVNGGQTTASLSLAKQKDKVDLGNLYVQMKLSVVSPTRAEVVIPEISRCANSQNKVSEADFFSNHPYHIRIESISRRIWAPAIGGAQHETHWFYERARGQYINEQVNLNTSEKRQFQYQNPRHQVITKTDIAKYINSWRGLPHTVSLGAQKNFKSFAEYITNLWEYSDAEFNEEYFRELVALAILFRNTERLVSEQPWYQKGYRANIVAYSIAKLANLINTNCNNKVLDLRSIWNRQILSDGIIKQLTLITKAAFEVIVSPELGFQNVTEWCKKGRCWESVKSIEVPLLKEFQSELIDEAERKIIKRSSKIQQKVDNGIEAQIQVVNLGATYWVRLMEWGKQHSLLTEHEGKLLKIASQLSSGLMPNDKQCIKLLNVKEKMELEGFII